MSTHSLWLPKMFLHHVAQNLIYTHLTTSQREKCISPFADEHASALYELPQNEQTYFALLHIFKSPSPCSDVHTSALQGSIKGWKWSIVRLLHVRKHSWVKDNQKVPVTYSQTLHCCAVSLDIVNFAEVFSKFGIPNASMSWFHRRNGSQAHFRHGVIFWFA